MTIQVFLRDNAPWLTAGVLLTFLSSFGQTFFISVFAGEIRAEFGLTHGQWGGIYSVGTTASALVMVWAGGLSDRFRARSLGAVNLGLAALACIVMAITPVWWMLPFAIFFLRFTGQGMSSHIAMVAMARWFARSRGKALSLATLGFSFGEALLPLIFVTLLVYFDWRVLWMVSAAICLFGIPFLLALLREERTPENMPETSQTLGMSDHHWTRMETIRHPLFWYMLPTLLGPSAFVTAFFFHQVHLAEIKEMSHVEFVAMFPFYTVISIAAMIGSGWAVDRFGAARTFPFVQLPIVIAFTLFAYANSLNSMLVAFFFFSITVGANTTVPSAFWAEFYGTRYIGSIKALAAAMMVLGSAIGPGLTGIGIDSGIGLETQFVMISGYFLFAIMMVTYGIAQYRAQLPTTA